MPEASPLPVTERTRHRRLREQGSTDRRDLADILAAGVICHLGVVVDGYPMVVPTVYGLAGDTLYLHGSVASRSLVSAPQATICVTVTHVDGLVLARSVFEHAVNYRSAMIYGTPRLVTDREEKLAGLRSLSRAHRAGPVGLRPPPEQEGTGQDLPARAAPGRGLSQDPPRPARRRRLPGRRPPGLGRRAAAGRRLAGPRPRPGAARGDSATPAHRRPGPPPGRPSASMTRRAIPSPAWAGPRLPEVPSAPAGRTAR